jgi:hypothetical protein
MIVAWTSEMERAEAINVTSTTQSTSGAVSDCRFSQSGMDRVADLVVHTGAIQSCLAGLAQIH